ncbi:MAG: DEAD/DEAH box helicase, partial [Gammaproteobacteria bacterium]|nr:DEAD/DEAH box helicase [Gammaproteobacteria bacterium]
MAEIYSMDEADNYGNPFHRLDFSDAVAMDLLSDYKVLVLMVNQEHANASVHDLLAMMETTNLNDAAKIIGCWNGLSKHIAGEEALPLTDTAPMRRAVAFCQSIAASRQVEQYFADIVQAYRQGSPADDTALGCTVQHVDGTQNALKRNQALQWLRDEPDENECRILSNVRCLSEGVDVPALDAVLFLSPRNSQVDVVQAVGRVMRKAEGKDYGYIILPVCVNEDMSPEEALQDDKTYKVVWQVLQALRAHDNRFNAEINKIELNKKREGRINLIGVGFEGAPDGDDNGTEEPETPQYATQLPLNLQHWKDALYARLVLKCGDRRYWESWAKDVAEIAGRNITRITTLVGESDADYREIFEEFMAELRQNINPSVTEADAIEMLAQHLITRPVFDALFEGYSFIKSNPVSKTMQAMLELLDEQNLETETKRLQGFYDSVRRRASGIDNAEGRQKVVIELYERFFKEAFPKMAESLGIVYTPVEIVDFILHSVNDLLVQEFGETLSSGNVHILDPFTGTGTFLTRLLASGLIMDTDLERKYRQELHANEVVLLAYYIAAVNIEETYHERLRSKLDFHAQGPAHAGQMSRRLGTDLKSVPGIYTARKEGEADDVQYESFPGIVLTDTFQVNERDGDMLDQIFPVNSERVMRQKDTPIRVVLGNPPYSAKQRSANDDNANLPYPRLDESIKRSYAEHSAATNRNSLYDSYIRAFRWASDRVGDEGIVAYVSNGGWLDGSAMDGFRRCLGEEFDRIYCFNLRGNARTSGEQRRKERGNVFGEGTRTNIAILFLVKKKDTRGKCQIRYHDIGDYLDRKQKLDIIRNFGTIGNMENLWETITPNKHHDWINQRSETFLSYLPLGDKEIKRSKGTGNSVFTLYSSGVKTNRDAWVYNFSKENLQENMQKTIAFYNSEVERYRLACERKSDSEKPNVQEFINYDSTKIHWADLTDCVAKGTDKFSQENLRNGIYRPFCKQWLYFDPNWNTRRYQQPQIFPKSDSWNFVICVPGIGGDKGF